jgi:hypothetical protein
VWSRSKSLSLTAAVIGCATDTLTTPLHSRAIAPLLGADYRELPIARGHTSTFGNWPPLPRELADVSATRTGQVVNATNSDAFR